MTHILTPQEIAARKDATAKAWNEHLYADLNKMELSDEERAQYIKTFLDDSTEALLEDYEAAIAVFLFEEGIIGEEDIEGLVLNEQFFRDNDAMEIAREFLIEGNDPKGLHTKTLRDNLTILCEALGVQNPNLPSFEQETSTTEIGMRWLAYMREACPDQAPSNPSQQEDIEDALVNFVHNLKDLLKSDFKFNDATLKHMNIENFYDSPDAVDAAMRLLTEPENPSPQQWAADAQIIADALHLHINMFETLAIPEPESHTELPNRLRAAQPDAPEAHHRGDAPLIKNMMPLHLAQKLQPAYSYSDEPSPALPYTVQLAQQSVLSILKRAGYDTPQTIDAIADTQWKALFTSVSGTDAILTLIGHDPSALMLNTPEMEVLTDIAAKPLEIKKTAPTPEIEAGANILPLRVAEKSGAKIGG